MKTDYKKIREDNIREYGEGSHHLSYFSDIYSIRTHFLYEILQNAEDALARRVANSAAGYVHFHLHNDCLEISHNGTEFTESNVIGICGIGKGTKTGDFTQIGKFGIGFKSVYAYTFYPQIHSGYEHFEIRRFVEPHPVNMISEDESETRFILPFDQPDKRPPWAFRRDIPAEAAVQEIGQAIQQLGMRTMLFLRNIQKITWTLPSGDSGCLIRNIGGNYGNATKIELQDNSGNLEEWCVFQRKCKINYEDKSHLITIELAYLVKDGYVTRASDTELVVYFPTEKKTELGFLIQGPFVTTKACDNIKRDEEANSQMVDGLAELAADSLEELRDLGLLNVASYNTFPLRHEDFPENSFFRPIYDRVRVVFKSSQLLPAHGGGFISAREAKLARVRGLVELFLPEQLGALFGKDKLSWLDYSVTQTGPCPDLYSYIVGERRQSTWIVSPLVENILVEAKDIASKLTNEFFRNQDEAWLIRFYSYISRNYMVFQDTPFIRLENGDHVVPSTSNKPNAYMPPPNAADIDQSIFPLVKQSLAAVPVAQEFFRQIVHLREPDEVDVVLDWLPKKYGDVNNKGFDHDNYIHDLKKIGSAYDVSNESARDRLVDRLKETSFIASVSASNLRGQITWKRPNNSDLFPRSDELEMWFSGNEYDKIWFPSNLVNEILPDKLKGKLCFTPWSFIRPHRAESGEIYYDSQYYRRKIGGFYEGADTVGLRWAVLHVTMERSIFLWKNLLVHINLIKGKEIKSKNRQFPINSTTEFSGYSQLGRYCTDYAWLPKQGTQDYYLPAELSLSDLPDDFEKNTPRAESLSRILGMLQPVAVETIQALGFHSEEELQQARAIAQSPDLLRKFQEFVQDKHREDELAALKKTTPFPIKPVPNPERRQEHLVEQLSEAPDQTYEMKMQSVRTSSLPDAEVKTYLRNLYWRQEDDKMYCQICKEEMPFRKRDGTHYFEKKEALKYLPKEDKAQYLALCPLCAAKYDEFVKADDDAMAELKQAIVGAEDCKVPITLDQETSIRFVETHLLDLKTIIKTSKSGGESN